MGHPIQQPWYTLEIFGEHGCRTKTCGEMCCATNYIPSEGFGCWWFDANTSTMASQSLHGTLIVGASWQHKLFSDSVSCGVVPLHPWHAWLWTSKSNQVYVYIYIYERVNHQDVSSCMIILDLLVDSNWTVPCCAYIDSHVVTSG